MKRENTIDNINKIGDLSNLKTAEKSTLVDAINDVNLELDVISSEFDKAVANVTNGNESATNSEIVQARGEEVNLNARLNKFDEQFINIVTENNTFKNQMNNDFGNAKVDYFREEHLNVVDRLNSDFDNVHQRINDSSLLHYEDNSITADRSYLGMTSDMTIRGRTLQNLCPDDLFFNKGNYTHLDASITFHNGYLKVEGNGTSKNMFTKPNSMLKPNSTYTIVLDVKTLTSTEGIFVLASEHSIQKQQLDGQTNIYVNQLKTGISTYKVTTKADFTGCTHGIRMYLSPTCPSGIIEFRYMVLEGDYTQTNLDIPYFNGIKSVGEAEKIGDKYKIGVKSHGKNLFDLLGMTNIKSYQCEEIERAKNSITLKKTDGTIGVAYYQLSSVKVKPNTKYILSAQCNGKNGTQTLLFFDGIDYPSKTFSGGFSVMQSTSSRIITTPSNVNELSFFIYPSNNVDNINYEPVKFTNIQLEEVDISQNQPTEYEEYQEYVKYLLLDEPHMGLETVQNTINKKGVETRRVGKIIIDENTLIYSTDAYENTVGFNIRPNSITPSAITGAKGISNKFKKGSNEDIEHFRFDGSKPYGGMYIWVDKNKLETQDLEGFKNLLRKWKDDGDPLTFYYELAEPIIIDHKKLMELQTFDEKTYISSTNSLPAKLSCKVPSNVNALLQDSRAKNVELTKELEDTTVKLENADEKLKEMDTDLVKTTWEMDDRLFEVEWALEDAGIGSVNLMNIKNKGVGVMALTKFEQAKIIIMSGDYDRVTLEGQLSKYLKRDIITQVEHDILISMMDAKEIVTGE